MAEKELTSTESFLNKALGYVEKAGNIWATQELAKKGVANPVYAVQTVGAQGTTAAVGQPANVQASNAFVDAVNNVTNKTAMVASASEVRKMLPYAVGGMALAITIYLLTKK